MAFVITYLHVLDEDKAAPLVDKLGKKVNLWGNKSETRKTTRFIHQRNIYIYIYWIWCLAKDLLIKLVKGVSRWRLLRVPDCFVYRFRHLPAPLSRR
jgi:hypothetical protein